MRDAEVRKLGRFDLRSLGLLEGPPEPAFINAVNLAVRITGAPTATLKIMDYDADAVRIRARAGDAGPDLDAVPAEKSLLGTLMSPRDTVAITGTARDPRTRGHPIVQRLGAQSLLAAPVFCPAEEAVGLLTVFDTGTRIWSVDDREALKRLADFCTQTILLLAALETVRIVSRRTGGGPGHS